MYDHSGMSKVVQQQLLLTTYALKTNQFTSTALPQSGPRSQSTAAELVSKIFQTRKKMIVICSGRKKPVLVLQKRFELMS